MINFQEIATMQSVLDKRIAEKFSIKESEVIDEKILALMVEFGELANEVRCFKFWSSTKKDNIKDIKEEYVDGLHFLLSIGNFLGQEQQYEFIQSKRLEQKEMTILFNDIFLSISELAKDVTKNSHRKCMLNYLTLGSAIGMGYEEIISEYKSKNEKNHTRQDNNY